MLAEVLGARATIFSFRPTKRLLPTFVCQGLGARINLDDITHIEFLGSLAGLPEEICCRYNPGDEFKINNKIMDNPGEAKYGFTYPQLVEGYKELCRAA